MSYEIKGLNEECGVFGVFGAENASQLTYFGLHFYNIEDKKEQELFRVMAIDYINIAIGDY